MSSIWTIRRSTSDAKLAGLCGGIAKHWGVDPVLVRVGFALLALSAGMGVVLYLAGWLLLPVEGKDKAPVDDLFGEAARKWPKEVWIAVVTLACVAMFAIFGSISPFSIGPAVVIAVIWYFGFYKPRQAKRTDAGEPAPPASLSAPTQPQFMRYPGPATPFTEAAEAWRRRIEENARRGPTARCRAVHLADAAPGELRRIGPPDRRPDAPVPQAPMSPCHSLVPPTRRRSRPRVRARAPSWPRRTRSVSTSIRRRPLRPPWSRCRRPARRDGCGFLTLILVGLTMSGLGVAEISGRLDPPRGLLRLRPAGGGHRADPGHLVRTGSRSARSGCAAQCGGVDLLRCRRSPQLPQSASPPLVYTSVSNSPPAVTRAMSGSSRSISAS